MADIGIACFGAVAKIVTEWVVVPIGRQVCFAFSYEKSFDDLKEKVEELKHTKERVQHLVNDARRECREIEKDVENWLDKVDELIERMDGFIAEGEDRGKKRCFKGLCPNPVTRYFFNKKAVASVEDCVRPCRKADGWIKGGINGVSYRPVLVKSHSMYARGYEEFETRTLVLGDIMRALNDANINMIGMYGMSGVGKTTLAKKVAWQAIQDKLFDVVVMVEIKQNPDYKKIQGDIASQLGLELQGDCDEFGRAAMLRERLKTEKGTLVILDDIWAQVDLEAIGISIEGDKKESVTQQVDLEAIGIPIERDKKESVTQQVDLEAIGIPIEGDKKESVTQQVDVDHEGRIDNKRPCTILLTSRRLDVLRNGMNTQKDFLVTELADEEAENLFWKIVGDTAENNEFKPIAVKIVSKCAGLPVAIETIASALKHKSLAIWKDALLKLRMFKTKNTIPEMDANVYSSIKLSYNYLDSEEAKSLFLLCGLYCIHDDISIEYLLRYGMGLGLSDQVYTLEDGRNRLYALIDKLMDSCLLMDVKNDFIRMHDVIRDVAISLASTDGLMYNIQDAAGAGLKKRLEDLPKDLTALSLSCRNFDELPERLEFPKLKFLYLLGEHFPLQNTDAFFEGVKELKVLDITRMHLSSVPSSICRLTNLQTLCLDQCMLQDIATLGGLKKLEILSLLQSDIRELPGEIRQLSQLKLLDLSNCSNLEVIAPNVISSLTQLEELYMGDSFVRWEAEGNASLAELKQLSRLTILEICVHDVQIMPKDLSFEKLDRFKILIGNVWTCYMRRRFGGCEISRALKLTLNNHSYLSQGVKALLKKTEDLYLDEMKGVKNILYELDNDGFRQLKHLHVQNAPAILFIVNSWKSAHCVNSFPKLEFLFLHNLINLEKVCHGKITPESFSKLKILKVGKCNKLKHLISVSMLRRLLNLQELEVFDCENLKEIISKESEGHVQENEGSSKIELPHLLSLRLLRLPQLLCFGFNVNMPSISQSLSPTGMGFHEISAEDDLPLFSHNVVLSSLENLTLSSINIECRWLNQFPVISSCCRTLTRLSVKECSGLKFLFSYSMVECMAQLQVLEIRNCKSMEGIIDAKELRQGNTLKMTFHKLKDLQLEGLPNLTRFGSGSSVEFPSLIIVEIEGCPNLKTFFSDSMVADIVVSKEQEEISLEHFGAGVHSFFDAKVELPTLASLSLSSIGILTMWHNQQKAVSSCFQNLTELIFEDCDNLKYLLSSSMIESFVQLYFLKISNCKSMVQVIDIDEVWTSKTLFPKLNRLILEVLPQLKTFCCFTGNSVQLPSFAKLIIMHCPKMRMFAYDSCADVTAIEDPEEANAEKNLHSFFDVKVAFPCLTDLTLCQLPELLHLWKGSSQPSKVFKNLEYLKVSGCHKLKVLVPSSVSLQNLIILEVENCDGLINLVTFSTARSLEKLTIMELKDCKMIESIIMDTGDELKDGIVFNQLEYLELCRLPSLTSFSIGNFTIEFPYLQRVLLIQCLKMMNFSQGVLSTPMLQRLDISEEDGGYWDGDLNATVQKLFKDMNVPRSYGDC